MQRSAHASRQDAQHPAGIWLHSIRHPPRAGTVMDLNAVLEDSHHGIRVRVQPGAGRRSLIGRHQDRLKICVTSPPQRGRADMPVV